MQGKVEEAGKELEKSIRLDPSNPMPHINKVRPPSLPLLLSPSLPWFGTVRSIWRLKWVPPTRPTP
jgi:hypothetical protein